jgi:hypothetical protein
MSRRAIVWGAAAALAAGIGSTVAARPLYLTAFKEHYKTAQGKPNLNGAKCNMCHIGAPNTKQWNVYGEALRAALGAQNVTDRAKIDAALTAAEGKMNPATNQSFIAMINADKFPGSAPAQNTDIKPVSGTWQPLFNGVNMEGWTKMNAGNWTVSPEGLLKYSGGGNGWLRSNQQFTNYAMVVVWRYPDTNPANDSGIFLKAGMEGNPWPGGPQLNLGPGNEIGSITGTQGSKARSDLLHQGDWNFFSVSVVNGVASLAINGSSAWEQATGLPTGPGYVGFEGEGRPIEIAQVWIMPLQ